MQQRIEQPRNRRRIGYVLVADSLVGLVLGIAGIVGLWWVEPQIQRFAASFVDLADRTVSTTSGLLVGVDDAVSTARDSLGAVQVTLDDVASTLDSTSRITRSAGEIAGTDMVKVIRETKGSLDTVRNSARLIDDTLGVIGAIPLIGRRYQPDVPLNESIARVSDSLTPLADSATRLKGELASTSTQFERMRVDIGSLSENLARIQTSLSALEKATSEYNSIAESLQRDMDQFRSVFPNALRFATLFGTAVMVWLIIAQLGLLTQGLERLQPPA
jgi:ABC-type transporter Mla subunit MlaD